MKFQTILLSVISNQVAANNSFSEQVFRERLGELPGAIIEDKFQE